MTDLLTIQEFCRRGSVGKTRVYELLNSGRVRGKKDGSKTLIPVSEFEAWKNSLPDYVGAQMGAHKNG